MDALPLLYACLPLLVLLLLLYRSRKYARPIPWLHLLFFCSGFPALVYEIVWQRALFAVYGVNIESATIVVGAFMLGLGLGSLIGGWISRRPDLSPLLFFGIAELGTAAFGAFSLRIFAWVASTTAGAPLWMTGTLSFLLLVVPTVLMGATLPLLVTYLIRLTRSVGHAVGSLYFVNTLGSAYACFISGDVLMRAWGQAGSAWFAAAINAVIGASVLLYWRFASGPAAIAGQRRSGAPPAAGRPSRGLIPFPLAVFGVGAAGFVALANEIVWYRLISFTTGGTAKAFAYLLGFYLAGIACGSLLAERFCRSAPESGRRNLTLVAGFIAAANIIGFLVAPLLAFVVCHTTVFAVLPVIFVAAGALGATFPLLSDLALLPDARAGWGLSLLYLANIVGATAGSVLVGFLLMDLLSIRQLGMLLLGAGLLLSMTLLAFGGVGRRRVGVAFAGGLAVMAAFAAVSPHLYDQLYERLQMKTDFHSRMRFAHVVETRAGVITVATDGTVYGGGIYDGKFNTDISHDSNSIIRAYALSSFHSAPRQVLMIGLASGSWAQVIANHPRLERLTIVEINPGYLRLIRRYPMVAPLLRNPRVDIRIDDGRRWLLAHPDRKFDAIVMNTTFHWREHVSDLLSAEFLRICRRHMNPGAITYYNTTDSAEVQATGAAVFPYALRVVNFLAVSDSPIRVDPDRFRQTLLEYRLDGRPVFDRSRPGDQATLDTVVALAGTAGNPAYADKLFAMEYAESIRRRVAGARIITDENMGAEWVKAF